MLTTVYISVYRSLRILETGRLCVHNDIARDLATPVSIAAVYAVLEKALEDYADDANPVAFVAASCKTVEGKNVHLQISNHTIITETESQWIERKRLHDLAESGIDPDKNCPLEDITLDENDCPDCANVLGTCTKHL